MAIIKGIIMNKLLILLILLVSVVSISFSQSINRHPFYRPTVVSVGGGSVQFDASTSNSDNSVTTLTTSFTISSSLTNSLLVVDVGGNTISGYWYVTSVTWNGSSLTRLDSTSRTGDARKRCERWYLLLPATGTHDVIVNVSASMNLRVGMSSWASANQSTTFSTMYRADGYGTTPTATAAATSGDVVIDEMWDGTTSATTAGGQTQLYNTAPSAYVFAGSYKNGAASVTMSWTISAEDWVIMAHAIKKL